MSRPGSTGWTRSASCTPTTATTCRCPAISGVAPNPAEQEACMLDQRHRAGWGVEVPWGPGALAEVRGCRRDSEARTPVTLVIPPTAGSCWPDHPDLVAVLEAGLVAVDVPHDIDFADPGRTLEAAHFL